MIAMTGGTGWCRKISSLVQSGPMNAAPVFLELVGRDFVGRHFDSIGMALGTSLRNPQRMDRGQTVFHRSNSVNSVAVDACRDLAVPGSKALSVCASLKEFELVDPLPRGVLAHDLRTAVASCAKPRNLRPGGFPFEPFRPTHGGIHDIAAWIAAMTTGA